MARRPRPSAKGQEHTFGGDWTQAKLDVLAKYLRAYTTATKKLPFPKAYIDAFAGTGYRNLPGSEGKSATGGLLFPDLAQEEPQRLLDGSARLALKVEPRFDRYIFIERDNERCAQLKALKIEFPDLADGIHVVPGEANREIKDLCSKDWRQRRAVLFLDPYGMQVEWDTIEAVASTKAIDLWLLVPLGMGMNRLATRSGNLPESWRKRLNVFLGTEDWFEAFYPVETRPTMFGDLQVQVKASMEAMAVYFNDRLRRVFAGVAEKPGILWNSSRSPLYLLCFAAANPKGAPVAVRIANHLLKDLR